MKATLLKNSRGKQVLCMALSCFSFAIYGMQKEKHIDPRTRHSLFIGELLAVGMDCEKDEQEAWKYLDKVAFQDDDLEAALWACLWLTKMSSHCGEQELSGSYFNRANSIMKGSCLSSLQPLVDLLNKYKDHQFPKESCQLVANIAAKNGDGRIIEFLSTYGVSIDTKILIWYAAQHAQVFLLEDLLSADEEIDEMINGNTPLHEAAKYGHLRVIRLLIGRGASTKAENEEALTPLHLACTYGKIEAVKELLKAGVEKNKGSSKHGYTALHFAAMKGYMEIVWLLLLFDVSIDVTDDLERTPLYYAAQEGHLHTVRKLLKHHANSAHQDKDGRTVLHCAAHQGHQDVVICLLEHGVDILSKNNDAMTAIHEAAQGGHEDVACLLILNGVSPLLKDKMHKAEYDSWLSLFIRALYKLLQ